MDSRTHPLAHWLALHRAPKVGPVTFAKLLNYFSTPEAVFTAKSSTWQEAQLKPALQNYLKNPDWSGVERDLAWLAGEQNHILTWADAAYPPRLKTIADPPPLLFVHGDAALLSQVQLAMVGSRNPSHSGESTCVDFAHCLSQLGWVITSGMAIGIDACAHRGALNVSGLTIAVMGTGLDVVYPASNRNLAHQIAKKGALVSEYPIGTPSKPQNFLRRNRIISGLSLGVLVVEATIHSGSLTTARCAADQGRDVFAIPGSIHNPLAKGCHLLIKQGAKLVDCVQDIVEELPVQLEIVANSPIEKSSLIGEQTLDADYQHMLGYMGIDEPISIDALIERCQLSANTVSSMLLVLELQGQVTSQAGGLYMRRI